MKEKRKIIFIGAEPLTQFTKKMYSVEELLNAGFDVEYWDCHPFLYPKRSLEVLMPNTEYLVVDASHIATSESIQEFIHSIRGMRLKNEPIPMNAIFSIEKYLMGISRKKRTLRRV